MLFGLDFSRGIKGGEASSGPHRIDARHNDFTRQRKRRQALQVETRFVTANFGNSLSRPERRRIALNRMRLGWKAVKQISKYGYR